MKDMGETQKKVFDYFKKDQTVVIGYKSIPRSLLGISVLSLFISGIFGILIGLAFPNMISYVNEQTQNSVQHFQISFSSCTSLSGAGSRSITSFSFFSF